MIEITRLEASHVLCVCLKGVQSAAEFEALGSSLPDTDAQRKLRILFDWTSLQGFDDRRSFDLSCRRWRQTAGSIARAAIVHQHRWDHYAALLAAVLRVQGVQVRSWPVRDHAQALVWLIR